MRFYITNYRKIKKISPGHSESPTIKKKSSTNRNSLGNNVYLFKYSLKFPNLFNRILALTKAFDK